MIVYNLSKSNTICIASEAISFFERLRGLMFRQRLEENHGLLISMFTNKQSIHSFFMRFPIDLIFIDENKIVADLHTLKPWRFYSPRKRCRWVLETKEGTIKAKNIQIGDELKYIPETNQNLFIYLLS